MVDEVVHCLDTLLDSLRNLRQDTRMRRGCSLLFNRLPELGNASLSLSPSLAGLAFKRISL